MGWALADSPGRGRRTGTRGSEGWRQTPGRGDEREQGERAEVQKAGGRLLGGGDEREQGERAEVQKAGGRQGG
jgi:hypothetical protein